MFPDLKPNAVLSVIRYRPCANPHDTGDRPIHLPAALTEYILTKLPRNYPRSALPLMILALMAGFDVSSLIQSPLIALYVIGAETPRSCTRRVGKASRACLENAKLISSTSVPLSHVIGPDILSTRCDCMLQLVSVIVFVTSAILGVILPSPPIVIRMHIFVQG